MLNSNVCSVLICVHFNFLSPADDGQNVFLSSINARCLIKVSLLLFVLKIIVHSTASFCFSNNIDVLRYRSMEVLKIVQNILQHRFLN